MFTHFIVVNVVNIKRFIIATCLCSHYEYIFVDFMIFHQ